MGQHDVVELRIPRKPEYVSVARLAVSGIAGRMAFSYDEVEDIKLAVGEACTSAIQGPWARCAQSPLVVRCESDSSGIRIEVVDAGEGEKRHSCPDGVEPPISRVLMEVLMDEVEVMETEGGGRRVGMVKYLSRDRA